MIDIEMILGLGSSVTFYKKTASYVVRVNWGKEYEGKTLGEAVDKMWVDQQAKLKKKEALYKKKLADVQKAIF